MRRSRREQIPVSTRRELRRRTTKAVIFLAGLVSLVAAAFLTHTALGFGALGCALVTIARMS